MFKKISVFIVFSFIALLPIASYAAIIGNLVNLSSASYEMGQKIYVQKKTLDPTQAYSACKTLVKIYDTKLSGSNANEEQFLYYMSPAQVTYCWAGYLNNIKPFSKITASGSISALMRGAYMLGGTLEKNNPDLSARGSFLTCKSSLKSYNDNVAGSNSKELEFLRLLSPGELSYCWSGYLDASNR
ncbi:MAG: hypothetical protein M1276_00560 [Deltaproteobacteria bacterium]|jgi:hypothetical protein|nr:hypothetical protein [Deltaproteobacteria bacterium]